MSHLDRQIAHYAAVVKEGKPLQAHYAMGALDVLRPLKAIHDEMVEDCKHLWKTRIGTGERSPHMVNFRVTKRLAKRIDGIEIGDSK